MDHFPFRTHRTQAAVIELERLIQGYERDELTPTELARLRRLAADAVADRRGGHARD